MAGGQPPREAWREQMARSTFVDALDTENRWCLAEVLDADSRSVTIHYHGWPPKYQERLPRNSDRLSESLSRTGHLDGATGETESLERQKFVEQLKPGHQVDVYHESANVWRAGTVLAISPDLSCFRIRCNRIPLELTVRIEQEFLLPPGKGNQREDKPGEAKAYGRTLKQNDYLDVRDKSVWRVAQVLQEADDDILCRFLGWKEAKWRVWLPRSSDRIAPPFAHVRGDTGAPERPILDLDCKRDCLWRRMVTRSLSRAHQQQLEHLFQAALSLQDRLQHNNFLPTPDLRDFVDALHAAVQRARKTVTLESKGEMSKDTKHALFWLDECQEVVQSLREACDDSQTAQDEVKLQRKEDDYFKQVEQDFWIVKVPADGSCLFAACSRGSAILAELRKVASSPDPQRALAALVTKVSTVTAVDNAKDSAEFRMKAIRALQSLATFHDSIRKEVEHAVKDYQTDRGRLNPTNKLIVRALAKDFPDNPAKGLHSPHAIKAYLRAMGEESIFGTDLEAEALSEDLRVPVCVYYREGDNNYSGQPTRVFGHQYPGPPICLAFYRGSRHYNLLVPKRPPSSTVPAPAYHFSFQTLPGEDAKADPGAGETKTGYGLPAASSSSSDLPPLAPRSPSSPLPAASSSSPAAAAAAGRFSSPSSSPLSPLASPVGAGRSSLSPSPSPHSGSRSGSSGPGPGPGSGSTARAKSLDPAGRPPAYPSSSSSRPAAAPGAAPRSSLAGLSLQKLPPADPEYNFRRKLRSGQYHTVTVRARPDATIETVCREAARAEKLPYEDCSFTLPGPEGARAQDLLELAELPIVEVVQPGQTITLTPG